MTLYDARCLVAEVKHIIFGENKDVQSEVGNCILLCDLHSFM
jgi:hypothetical protein